MSKHNQSQYDDDSCCCCSSSKSLSSKLMSIFTNYPCSLMASLWNIFCWKSRKSSEWKWNSNDCSTRSQPMIASTGTNVNMNCNQPQSLLIQCPNCHAKTMASMIHGECNISPEISLPFSESLLLTTNQNRSATHLTLKNDKQHEPHVVRSPSNYCRVATCEKLHLHELTPKCLETFAPSSTCSSCQHCDRQHIGPNHDQLLMVKRLLKELPLTPSSLESSETVQVSSGGGYGQQNQCQPPSQMTTTSQLLMQWPLPEYRPQHSPDHLYKSFAF